MIGRSAALLSGLASAATLAAQDPGARFLLPEVVLSAAADPVGIAEFGLGDGGVATMDGSLRWFDRDGGIATPGGVRIEVRSAGVRLTFPSGRELLVAPDGSAHLRDGEVGGRWPGGVELRLADGARVRIVLAADQRQRLRDVVVVAAGRALQLWRNGKATLDEGRDAIWAGPRLACCGDGGSLYRIMALGPLVVLDRVLAPVQAANALPEQRLVVLVAALHRSLALVPRQHREPDAAVRQAVAAVEAVAGSSDHILPGGAALQRAEHDQLRWLLPRGFELALVTDGPQAPRLQLFAGRGVVPMVEWTLASSPAAYMTNPKPDQPDKRWHGNGTRLPPIGVDMQAREQLRERMLALRVIQRMRARR